MMFPFCSIAAGRSARFANTQQLHSRALKASAYTSAAGLYQADRRLRSPGASGIFRRAGGAAPARTIVCTNAFLPIAQ